MEEQNQHQEYQQQINNPTRWNLNVNYDIKKITCL